MFTSHSIKGVAAMDKHEDKVATLTDIDLETISAGAQEDYFTYQRQEGSFTYQRTDGALTNGAVKVGGHV
jgi:hypothetical protein